MYLGNTDRELENMESCVIARPHCLMLCTLNICTVRLTPADGVLLVLLGVLMFGRELDPHQSPRERVPPDRLSRASRCARRGDVDGTDRHDQPRA